MKAVVAALNQEKALVGAFSVITNLRMDLFQALMLCLPRLGTPRRRRWWNPGSRSWGCGRRSSCTTGPPSPRPTPTSPPPPPGPSSPSPARRPTGPSIRAKPLLMANVMLYQNLFRGTYKFRKYMHRILSIREFQTLLIFSNCFFSKL